MTQTSMNETEQRSLNIQQSVQAGGLERSAQVDLFCKLYLCRLIKAS